MVNRRDRIIAHHEAGHAVVARMLGVGVTHVALFPTVDTEGVAGACSESAAWQVRAADAPARLAAYEKDAKVALAGPQAQHRYRPVRDFRKSWINNWRDDGLVAKSCAARIVLLADGIEMGDAPVHATFTEGQGRRINATLQRLMEEAAAMVEENWPAIERVAQELLHRKILAEADLDALIANRDPIMRRGIANELWS
jgi:hypothetical protein